MDNGLDAIAFNVGIAIRFFPMPTIFAKIVDMNGGDYSKAFVFICLVERSFLVGSLFLREKR